MAKSGSRKLKRLTRRDIVPRRGRVVRIKRPMSVLDLLDLPAANVPESPTIGERLAELTYKNSGRLIVATWGHLEVGGIYGYVGLQEHEAMELTHLGGLIRGFGMAQPNPAAVDREVTRWIRSRWTHQPPWAGTTKLHT